MNLKEELMSYVPFDEQEEKDKIITTIEELQSFYIVKSILSEYCDSKKITYKDCMNIVSKLKFNSNSYLFALERNNGLKTIIGTIYQSFDGKDLYNSIEEKAANFLYLIIKNHVFIDGNKRIAATLFIYFLGFYNILYNGKVQVIDNNTLVALTLLIAQSNPKEKDILVDLVMNFLNQ